MPLHQQPECETGQPAKVTILGEREKEVSGQLDGPAGLSLRLILDSAVALGAAVKVEWGDTLLLGEVVRCQPASGRYSVLLHLEHSLLHTADLARLAAKLLEQAAGVPAEQRAASDHPASRLNQPRTA